MRALAAIFLIAAAAAAAAPRSSDGPKPRADRAPPDENEFGDRYAIVIERNIFSRTRPHRYVRPGAVDRDRMDSKPIAPSPEENLILTGVVRQDEVYTAFIEDVRTAVTVRARVGDAMARGKVTAISIGSVTYEREGKPVEIEVGRTLAGGSARGIPAPTKASGEKSTSAGEQPNSDVLERLRQRRLQEMKK